MPAIAITPAVMVQEGDGEFLAQAAHLAHVLFAAQAVDDGACGKEEQCFEEGVGHQVEDGG
jgi:hypothetical protein